MRKYFLWIQRWGWFLPLMASTLSGMTIRDVLVEYRESSSFIRISEYLTGRPAEPSIPTLRSSPDTLEGLYYLVVLDEPLNRLPQTVVVELSVLTDGDPEPVRHEFSLSGGTSRKERFLVGLTGEAWPSDPDAPYPTAWRIRLLETGGKVLAEKRSFLWGTR